MAFGDPRKITWNIPRDARVVHKIEEWEIYHSRAENSLYIYPTEYHSVSLKLDSSDLRDLMRKLDAGVDDLNCFP
ncbi:MAG: hypothetical protein KGK44_11740 [Gammaproteobacteria bacterium]|nr:hypothetical protein [Gammaproteobacteria bacterium]